MAALIDGGTRRGSVRSAAVRTDRAHLTVTLIDGAKYSVRGPPARGQRPALAALHSLPRRPPRTPLPPLVRSALTTRSLISLRAVISECRRGGVPRGLTFTLCSSMEVRGGGDVRYLTGCVLWARKSYPLSRYMVISRCTCGAGHVGARSS